jgi:lysophospholipase L1-like esterase
MMFSKKILFMLMFNVLQVEAYQRDVVIYGDSWVNERNRLTKHLVTHFRQSSGLSGAGFCTLVESNGTADHNMIYLPTYSGWDVSDQDADSAGLNISHLSGDSAGLTLNFYVKSDVDVIEVYYLKQPGGGSFSAYGQNALLGTVVTDDVNRSSAKAVFHWSPSVLPKYFRVKISDPNVSGVIITGVNFKTHSEGVRIHKVGNGGLTARQSVAVDEEIWIDSLEALNPDIFCILLGTNDYARNVILAEFKTDIAELVRRVRLAKPAVEIMLMAPGDNGLTGRIFEIADYRDVLIELCLEEDLKFIDFKEVLGDYATANSLGLYSDEIHPNNAGGALMADAWLSLIIEGESGVPDEVIDVLNSRSFLDHSDFSLLDVVGRDVRVQWRRLPGVEYTLCKSLDLDEWDEVSLPTDYPQRVFINALNEEENNFFKLKASYPGIW